MITILLQMPRDLLTRLTAAANERGISRSALVRTAVRFYLGADTDRHDSAAGLAADLLGSLDGPCDLSHDARHLEGFGR